jgi:hypothetical protein
VGFSDDVSLMFRIKADSSQGVSALNAFSAAAQKETDKVVQSFTGMTGAAGRLASSLGPVGLGVTALTGAVIAGGGAIFEFAKHYSEAANDIYNFHQRTNVSVEVLSALRVALTNSGSSLDRFQNGLVFFQKNIEKVNELVAAGKDKNNDLAKSFKALGIDVTSNETALMTAFRALSKVGEGTEQVALAQRLFRGSAKDVLAIIKESHGDFDAYTERLRKMGLIIGTEAAVQAHEFNIQLQQLQLEAEAAGRTLGEEVLPTITGAIEDLTGAMSGNMGVLKSWGEDLRNVLQLAEAVVETLKKDDKSSSWETPADTARRFGANLDRIQRRDNIQAGRVIPLGGEMTQAQRDAAQRRSEEERTRADRSLYSQYLKEGQEPPADLRARLRGSFDPSELGGHKPGGGADKAAQEAERVIKESLRAIEEEYARHIEVLRRDYGDEVISSQAYTKGIIDEANDRFEKLKAALDKERALQKKQSGRDRIDNEIQRAQDARDREVNDAQDAQFKRERDGLIRHRQALLDLADKYDAQSIASIQVTAEARAITYEDAEGKVFNIQTAAFDRRLQAARDDEARFYAQQKDLNDVDVDLAQAYSDRIAAIVAEQEGAQLEHERRTDAARRRDIDAERIYLENMRRMKAQAVASALDVEREAIEAGARSGGKYQTRAERSSIITSFADNARKREEQEHKDRQAAIQSQANDNLDRAKTEDERLQALKTYNQLTEDEYARHLLALGKIGDEEQLQKGELSPLKALRDELNKFKEETDFSPLELAGQAVGQLFESLKTNVLSSIDAIITGGKGLKQALADMGRQILVELASWLAKKAALKGAEELAEGFSDLANPFMAWHAPTHFYAAAGWFALAGAAAIGGRLVAGAGGGGGGTSGASAGQAVAGTNAREDNRTRYEREQAARDAHTIREARRGGAPDPTIPTVHVVIHDNVQTEPGLFRKRVVDVVGGELENHAGLQASVGRAFMREYRSMGDMRDMVRDDALR